MKLDKSASLALWIIVILLIIPYYPYINRLMQSTYQSYKSKIEKRKATNLAEQIKRLENQTSVQNRKKKSSLIKRIKLRAKEICTDDFLALARESNIENHYRYIKELRKEIPGDISLDILPYSINDIEELVTLEDCLEKYATLATSYAKVLEMKNPYNTKGKDEYFTKWYFKQYQKDPNWPDCVFYGYPACKKIEPTKWKFILDKASKRD